MYHMTQSRIKLSLINMKNQCKSYFNVNTYMINYCTLRQETHCVCTYILKCSVFKMPIKKPTNNGYRSGFNVSFFLFKKTMHFCKFQCNILDILLHMFTVCIMLDLRWNLDIVIIVIANVYWHI